MDQTIGKQKRPRRGQGRPRRGQPRPPKGANLFSVLGRVAVLLFLCFTIHEAIVALAVGQLITVLLLAGIAHQWCICVLDQVELATRVYIFLHLCDSFISPFQLCTSEAGFHPSLGLFPYLFEGSQRRDDRVVVRDVSYLLDLVERRLVTSYRPVTNTEGDDDNDGEYDSDKDSHGYLLY